MFLSRCLKRELSTNCDAHIRDCRPFRIFRSACL